MKLIKFMLAFFAVVACVGCAAFKPTARSINDAAKVACEAMFAAEAEAKGVSLEDICATREVLDPIIRQLLAAKAAARQGTPALNSGR